jgi:opacity protein-like surface antigen
MKNRLFLVLLFSTLFSFVNAQDDLMKLLDNGPKSKEFTTATFKSSRIVIGQSIEIPAPGDMMLIITHHFGALNSGYDNLFGLKQATIRLGLDFGITPWLGANIGLNTEKNTWDGAMKVKILRQSSGAKKMPVTVELYGNMAVYTDKWENPERDNYFTSRLTYAFQPIVARKFSNAFSLQIMPSVVHKNLVPTHEDKNTIFTLGGGGRLKISQRVSVNAEYHHLFSGQVVSTKAYDSFSLGVDIETGGHVFQMFLTNSYGEYEQAFLTETKGKWSNGDIFLGFNITRMFTIVPRY